MNWRFGIGSPNGSEDSPPARPAALGTGSRLAALSQGFPGVKDAFVVLASPVELGFSAGEGAGAGGRSRASLGCRLRRLGLRAGHGLR